MKRFIAILFLLSISFVSCEDKTSAVRLAFDQEGIDFEKIDLAKLNEEAEKLQEEFGKPNKFIRVKSKELDSRKYKILHELNSDLIMVTTHSTQIGYYSTVFTSYEIVLSSKDKMNEIVKDIIQASHSHGMTSEIESISDNTTLVVSF